MKIVLVAMLLVGGAVIFLAALRDGSAGNSRIVKAGKPILSAGQDQSVQRR